MPGSCESNPVYDVLGLGHTWGHLGDLFGEDINLMLRVSPMPQQQDADDRGRHKASRNPHGPLAHGALFRRSQLGVQEIDLRQLPSQARSPKTGGDGGVSRRDVRQAGQVDIGQRVAQFGLGGNLPGKGVQRPLVQAGPVPHVQLTLALGVRRVGQQGDHPPQLTCKIVHPAPGHVG